MKSIETILPQITSIKVIECMAQMSFQTILDWTYSFIQMGQIEFPAPSSTEWERKVGI